MILASLVTGNVISLAGSASASFFFPNPFLKVTLSPSTLVMTPTNSSAMATLRPTTVITAAHTNFRNIGAP
jgi:hypothetical protein